ncbi:MAG: methyltransferase family protein [Candidatus Bruticola sp.]
MIRTMRKSDAPILAAYHCRLCNLPAELLSTAVKIYQAIFACPNVQVFTAENDQKQIEGFCLAIADRNRIISELFSYIPLNIVACLAQNRTKSAQLLKLLGVSLGSAPHQAEVAMLCDFTGNGNNLKEMLGAAVSFLASRGKKEIYLPNLSGIDESILQSQGFIQINPSEIAQANIHSPAALYKAAVADPQPFVPGPFTFQDRLRCFFRFEQMVVYPIYCGCLIPFASYLAYLAKTRIDPWLGLDKVSIINAPWNWLAFAICLLVGGLILVYSYSYLILEGEGGPVPPWSSQTRRLVTTGPYTYIRHPSIWAKLIGVCGLGLAFNSPSFLAIVIPLLMVWSVFWNRNRQDEGLILAFGDEYLRYKEQTPMLIPNCIKRLLGRHNSQQPL